MNFSVIGAMIRLRMVRVLKDRTGLVWLLVMPMVFSFLMGQLMGDWSGGGSAAKPKFIVYGKADGPAAASFLEPLRDNERFEMVLSDTMVTWESARAAVEKTRITAALFVPENFSLREQGQAPDTLRLVYDSDRLSSQTVRTELDRAVLEVTARSAARSLVQLVTDSGADIPPDRAARFDETTFDNLWNDPRVTLESSTLGRLETDDLDLTKAAQHVGPAYILFFVMMFLMITAKDLVQERQDRTLARLVMSRASSLDLVMGMFLGGMVIGLVQSAILLVLNSLAFGLDYGDSPMALILVIVLFAGFSSASAILLGSMARSGPQAEGLGMALTMTLASLGGLWWPLEIVPEFMYKLGMALPTGQAITVFHDMIGRGYGVAELAGPLTGLAMWFAGVFLLATWRLRKLVAV